MVLKVFSVFDSDAGAFMQPFYSLTVAVAKRNISRAVLDETTDFHAFPERYSLFEVGEWDSEGGKFSAPVAPIPHGIFTSFVKLEAVK